MRPVSSRGAKGKKSAGFSHRLFSPWCDSPLYWRIRSEILKLQWRQVDFEAGRVTLDPGTTKNDQGRVFPFTDQLRELLESSSE